MTLGLTEILGGLAGVVFLVMSFMVKSAKHSKKEAELDRDIAEKKAKIFEQKAKSYEKVIEQEQSIDKAVQESRDDSVNDIANRMRAKAKHRDGANS